MNNKFDFSQFSHQSKKGILVIYANLLFKFLKATWILVFLFFKDFSRFPDYVILYIYLGLGLLLIFFFVRAYLIFKNFQFKIDQGYFVLQQGVLKKSITSISFDRIQNINFKQNLIQQLIDVYQVNIETAGSNKTEISIKALSFQEAESLKKQLSSGEKTAISFEDELEEKPFLKISPLELLKVSLTENHLQSLLIFVALLVGFFQQLKEVFKSLGKDDLIDDYLKIDNSAFQESLILVFILFVLLLFVAIISSFVRVFLLHFNLTVFIKNQAFEIHQGLLTKKSIILKKEKIQHITISHNPIKKKLGISFITFKQAVSGKVNKKTDKLIRIVGCRKEQVEKIKELLFDCADLEKSKREHSDSYLKYRMYLRSFFFFLILNIWFYAGFDNGKIFFSNILLVFLVVFFNELTFKKRFYKMDDEFLLVGNGSIETHLTYLPFYKVQNIKLNQTFFQERKQVADLVLQTASGKVKIPCLPLSEALKIYNYTLFKAESSKNPWM
jgi:putative membrane protein